MNARCIYSGLRFPFELSSFGLLPTCQLANGSTRRLYFWPSGQLINQGLPIHHLDHMPYLLIGHHRADRQRDDFAMQGF